MSKDTLTIGQTIQKERIKAVLSREDLGNLSKVHPILIMQIEKGQREITLSQLAKIFNAMPGVGAKLRILKSVGFEL